MNELIEFLCVEVDLCFMIAVIDLLSAIVRTVGYENAMDRPRRRVLESCCQMTSFWTASRRMWHSKSFHLNDQHFRTTKFCSLPNHRLYFNDSMHPRGFPLESMPASTLLITLACW